MSGCCIYFSSVRFLLKDGQLWLCAPQAKQIWKCLAENAVFLCDREACFKWYHLIEFLLGNYLSGLISWVNQGCITFLKPNRYSKLMGDEPDLDPDINKDFFENNVLQLDPSLLTENGMKCFERFFKAVNCREGKLVAKRRAYMMDDLELIGLDYLWRVRKCIAQSHKCFFIFTYFTANGVKAKDSWSPFCHIVDQGNLETDMFALESSFSVGISQQILTDTCQQSQLVCKPKEMRK